MRLPMFDRGSRYKKINLQSGKMLRRNGIRNEFLGVFSRKRMKSGRSAGSRSMNRQPCRSRTTERNPPITSLEVSGSASEESSRLPRSWTSSRRSITPKLSPPTVQTFAIGNHDGVRDIGDYRPFENPFRRHRRLKNGSPHAGRNTAQLIQSALQ